MENMIVQLLVVKGHAKDLQYFKVMAFLHSEQALCCEKLLRAQVVTVQISGISSDLVCETCCLKKELDCDFSIKCHESDNELHYYIKWDNEEFNMEKIAIEFPQLQFIHLIIDGIHDSIRVVEYSNWIPTKNTEFSISGQVVNWQNSFRNSTIADIEELYLKVNLLKTEKKLFSEKQFYADSEPVDFYSFFSRIAYVNRFKQTLLGFVAAEQDVFEVQSDVFRERFALIGQNSIFDIVRFYVETLKDDETAEKIIKAMLDQALKNKLDLSNNESNAINYAYKYLDLEKEIVEFSKEYIEIQLDKADLYQDNYNIYCKKAQKHKGVIPCYNNEDDVFIKKYIAEFEWLSSDLTSRYFDKVSALPGVDVFEEAMAFQDLLEEAMKVSELKVKEMLEERWMLKQEAERNLQISRLEFKDEPFNLMSYYLFDDCFFDDCWIEVVTDSDWVLQFKNQKNINSMPF